MSDAAAQAVANAPVISVCGISAWEIAIKLKSGKLAIRKPVHEWYADSLVRYRLDEVPLTVSLLCAAADLPLLHRDPFDRVLVAAAIERGLTLITSDRIIPTYPGVKVIW